MIEKNKYVIGDNLKLLNKLDNESFQLCYIDPPYNTGRDFDDFKDEFKNNSDFAYEFLKPRIELIHQKLKSDGTIAVHCDSKASHYIRMVLDEIFGEKNFKNEIVWVTTGNKKTTRLLARSHDTIFIYSKSNKQKFEMIYLPYEDKGKTYLSDERGEYDTSAAHNSQPDVIKRPNLRYEWNGHKKQWWVSKEKMQKLHDENRLRYNDKGIPRIKRYFSELKGRTMRDVWSDISSIQGNEKLDYATQKPVKLLERIVGLYTDKNDYCLDCFAGSGTLGRACLNLNRNFYLIDINEKGNRIFESSISDKIYKFV
jgi:DNA modification methylase|tara:strand:+ start:500 stop:1435 length:936 start_codon:yes stop_codon:yes gene_type:complete